MFSSISFMISVSFPFLYVDYIIFDRQTRIKIRKLQSFVTVPCELFAIRFRVEVSSVCKLWG